MAKKPRSVEDRICDTAIALASETPWQSIALADIASAAKLSLSQLHAAYPSRAAIVAAVMTRITRDVVAGHDPADLDEPPHDRLLDAMLRRFDAMTPNRAAIRSILRSLPGDPLGAACMAPHLFQSMGWVLESAGISSGGLLGGLRVKGVTAVYLAALPVWLRDDTEDLSRTAAFLDRRLRQAGRLASLVPGLAVSAPHKGEEEKT